MDSRITDIIQQLNNLCNKYRSLQDYFSKNDNTLLNGLEMIVTKHHRDYEIDDICDTNVQIEEKDYYRLYAFIYHMNEALGFYEFLQMYQLNSPRYETLRQEAYDYYYQYAVDHMISSQVDFTKIDWKMVKAYIDKDQSLITQFFKRM